MNPMTIKTNIRIAAKYNKFIVFICALFICHLSFLQAPAFSAEASGGDPSEMLSKFGDAMSKVAERAKHAVVNISTTKTVKTLRSPLFEDPLFRRFFGDGGQQKRKITSLGSGFIASTDGYILTSNHVIEGAEDILIRLDDNREYKGKIVGMDSKTDIAVIKISEKDLSTVQWGDSDRIRVGEMVLAIGNPYGLSHTVTMGIISALGRTGIGLTDYEDFIQTDAAINPGNSGGPLLNTKGEVIGINTAIFSTSGGYQGVGFAIPVNMVKNVMDGIINQGKVIRGWLGVQVQPLTKELAKQFNLKTENGALLVDTVEGGPADKGGLKRGDVIVEYDGKKITDPFHFKNMVASTKPGATVQIKIIRDGNMLTAKVVIGELAIEPQIISSAEFNNALKGVFVQELTEDYLKKFNISKKLRGVVVNNIEENSPSLGVLSKGDLILEINRKSVENTADYSNVASVIEKTQDILVLIVREGISQYITIPAPKAK